MQDKNHLNNEDYFADFKNKMMHYAKENPKVKAKKTFNIGLWSAAAAIVLMIVGAYAMFNFEKQTPKIVDVENSNLGFDSVMEGHVTSEKYTNTSNSLNLDHGYTQEPIVIQNEKILTVGYETIEKQILDEDLDEAELLEMLPNEVLDDWLAEYDI